MVKNAAIEPLAWVVGLISNLGLSDEVSQKGKILKKSAKIHLILVKKIIKLFLCKLDWIQEEPFPSNDPISKS
jgi:hypothetical protein